MSIISWSLVKYTLKAALRDKLLHALIVMLLAGASLAIFMGSAVFIEKDQFSLVFAAGALRFASILGLVLFVVFHVRRSFDLKDIEFLLSRPIGRIQLLISFSMAFSILSVVLGLAVGAVIYALSPHLISMGHVHWVVSLLVENIIMVNAALFFAMVLSSAASAAMISCGLYVLGRLMGQILGVIDAGAGALSVSFLSWIMEAISIVTPRLDLMGQTSWLIYGAGDTASFISLMLYGLIFSGVLLCAALVDLARRQF